MAGVEVIDEAHFFLGGDGLEVGETDNLSFGLLFVSGGYEMGFSSAYCMPRGSDMIIGKHCFVVGAVFSH